MVCLLLRMCSVYVSCILSCARGVCLVCAACELCEFCVVRCVRCVRVLASFVSACLSCGVLSRVNLSFVCLNIYVRVCLSYTACVSRVCAVCLGSFLVSCVCVCMCVLLSMVDSLCHCAPTLRYGVLLFRRHGSSVVPIVRVLSLKVR